jgi:hypothetical protein
METKQTAVEWLEIEIDNKDMGEVPMWIYDFIQKAKQMEKQQIMNAYWASYKEGQYSGDKTAEEYYNETYGK